MPIVIKHSGNVAPALMGAFGGGKGRRQAEDARQAAAIAANARQAQEQRNLAERQAMLQRRFASREAAAARQFRRDENDTAYQRQLELIGIQSEGQEAAAEADLGRALREKTFDSELRRDDINFEYTAKQRAEFDRISSAYDDAVASGEFTADELREVRRQVSAKLAGIEPLPRLKQLSPWPKGQDVGETWQSSDGRFLLTRDAEGKVSKLADTNRQPTVSDVATLYKQGFDSLKTVDADGNETAPSPEDLDAFVERAIKLHRRLTGGPAYDPKADTWTPEEHADAEKGARFRGAGATGSWDDDGHVTIKDPAKDKVLSKIKSESDFVAAFTSDQGRAPTAKELEVAKARGYFK